MEFVIFSAVFWVFSVVYILLEAKSMTGSIQTSALKAIPALSAALFAILSGTTFGLFHILLMAALIFCGLGDIAMEYDILPGLELFLIAHILFTANFGFHSLANLELVPILAFILAMIFLFCYILFFHKYLQGANEPTELLPGVDVYAILISLTFGSSLLLWLSTATMLGFLPLLGAGFFIFSDSLIGVREFHHRFKYDEALTMITYYLAVFLLSLGSIVYAL
ncbi:MAG: lysoplasmalogenase family protein [Promethearchaeia archaeon]